MSKTKNQNLAKAKAYCDKHPGAFSIVKKEDHSIFKNLSNKEYKELKAHVESKVPDIGSLSSKQKETTLVSKINETFKYSLEEDLRDLVDFDSNWDGMERLRDSSGRTRYYYASKKLLNSKKEKEKLKQFIRTKIDSGLDAFQYLLVNQNFGDIYGEYRECKLRTGIYLESHLNEKGLKELRYKLVKDYNEKAERDYFDERPEEAEFVNTCPSHLKYNNSDFPENTYEEIKETFGESVTQRAIEKLDPKYFNTESIIEDIMESEKLSHLHLEMRDIKWTSCKEKDGDLLIEYVGNEYEAQLQDYPEDEEETEEEINAEFDRNRARVREELLLKNRG